MNGILLFLFALFVLAVGLTFRATDVNWVIFAVFAVLLLALAYAAWHLIGERYGEPREVKLEHRHHHLVPLSLLLHWGFIIVLIALIIALFTPNFTTRFAELPALTQFILVLLFFSFLAVSLYVHWLVGGRELYGRASEAWNRGPDQPRRVVTANGTMPEAQPMITKVQQLPMEVVVQQQQQPHKTAGAVYPDDVMTAQEMIEARAMNPRLERQLRRHRADMMGGQ